MASTTLSRTLLVFYGALIATVFAATFALADETNPERPPPNAELSTTHASD